VVERVERALPDARWIPTPRPGGPGDPWHGDLAGRRARLRAERRAGELGLPLVWPARGPAPRGPAMRAATWAAQVAAGPAFALAATRLVFCGGFDVDDLEVLAEAAAAAGLPLDACLRAAGDPRLDLVLRARERALRRARADRLPVLRAGARLRVGERQVASA
jgi:2-hydroxychromene-2-carboxylate isomerase